MIVTRGRLISWAFGVREEDVLDVLDVLDSPGGAAEAVEGLDPDALDPDEAVEILVSEDDSEGLHGTEVERVADGEFHAKGYLECYARGETREQALEALRQVARDCRDCDAIQGRLSRQRESIQALRVAHNQLATEMHPEPACEGCKWARLTDAGSRACDLPMLGDVHWMNASAGTILGRLLVAQASSGRCPYRKPAEVRVQAEVQVETGEEDAGAAGEGLGLLYLPCGEGDDISFGQVEFVASDGCRVVVSGGDGVDLALWGDNVQSVKITDWLQLRWLAGVFRDAAKEVQVIGTAGEGAVVDGPRVLQARHSPVEDGRYFLKPSEWPEWLKEGRWECSCGEPEAVTVDLIPGVGGRAWRIRCVCGVSSVLEWE